ncbi:lysine ketoglutarate reductase trans-splicing protein [Perilla frutescens var. hirtella]|uniref:Lysine ketoglutarate reductase trans-splicing protein n=1 Tax=Perilla frutescens var. hirtella TaxID=608512 RepID=A0AAD4J1C9_PERFH|nr:lysine ketoglutarate reductase trans-splicing protein [Perilla frutescens var. hirtella]KAH6825277.1 lysine ketoglutarate reductase trans-splicing protein [Perilla frutescens var. hirtella]
MEAGKVHSKGHMGHSIMVKKPYENIKLLITVSVGMMFGFFMGVLIPKLPSVKINTTSIVLDDSAIIVENITAASTANSTNISGGNQLVKDISKVWAPSNPKGAERLPPGIVISESDLYPRRLWGLPKEDLPIKPKYLVTFTVGYDQRNNIDKAVKKFSESFTILLFHYDGRTTEWDDFEWSKRAIHISARKQTKWWYAKRFLHPDIVAPYDYIFIWDEDLGVEHFDAEEYIRLVRKHGLEISQPGLEPRRSMPWQMTKKRDDSEIHKETEEKRGFCHDPHLPPCAAFVEIMAPVFSRDAWRCVWHMIQNDLVHGWGLDFALQKCVEPAHEKIGVVDAQWIVHQTVPSLGGQGESENGEAPWQGVRLRCRREWSIFQSRMANAEKSYYKSLQI